MFYRVLLILIFAVAFYLRADAYLINNSFFTDEILLAMNVFERKGLEFLYPLNYFQAAPVGFMLFSKFITQKIGITELCFRFIPFISSIISVILFYMLSDIVFKNKYCKLFSLFIFGISYQLLFYTQTFKPYSSDVMLTILFLYIVFKVYNKVTNIAGVSAVGFVSFLMLCFSFPMFIVVPAFYTSWFITVKELRIKIAASLPFLFAGGGFFILFYLGHAKTTGYFINYWHKGFELFSSEIYKLNFQFLFYDFAFPLLLLVLLICGFYFLFKRNKFYFWTLFLIIIYTLFAALLKLYPFERRLILFLLPVFIIVSIYPLDNKKTILQYSITALISLLFFGYGIINFTRDFTSGKVSYLRQDVKPLLNEILKIDKNDKLYLYYGAIASYSYYSRIMKLPISSTIIGTYPVDEKLSDKYLIKDFEQFSSGREYYLLFIKGTSTYERDIDSALKWLSKNALIEKDLQLKSTRLFKIKKNS